MEVSSVKLRNTYQTYYIDTNNIFVGQNSLCVVETEHGIDLGNVIKAKQCCANKDAEIKGKLIRKANDEDMEKLAELEDIEERAYESCKEKAKNKNLEMKLISTKCLLDKTKIIFYFVAENRIDFRELVRELASVFRTRIEMRQIGVRDEARLVGGFGPCGLQQCCLHQRYDFDPVSIKMAKEQHLNLNSLKISGMCGRLLCCLGYEYDTYREENKDLPREGTEVHTKDKSYTVISVDSLRGHVKVANGNQYLDLEREDFNCVNDRCTVHEDSIKRATNAQEEDKKENSSF